MNASVQQALQGVMALARQSRFAEAKAACARILAQHPDDPNACYLGGMLAFQTGETDRGIALLEKALRANPANAAGLYNLGVMLQAAGRQDDAVRRYDQCLKSAPTHAGAWNNRGNALSSLDRLDDALASFDRALAIQPAYLEAWLNKAGALLKASRIDEALSCYDRAIAIRADVPEAHVGRGDALLTLDRAAEALASYERALKLRPGHAEAERGRALALKGSERLDDVISQLTAQVAEKPDAPELRHELASALTEARRFDAALEQCERAAALAPQAPRHRALMANVLVELYRPQDAMTAADAALALDPGHADALFNRASALMLMGRFDDARANLERVITIEPAQPRAHFSKALCCLLTGDYANGWPAYEWRTETVDYRKHSVGGRALDRRHLRAPGLADVRGKRVVVLDEQGVGDTIMFCSVAPDLVRAAASVDLVVDPRLERLLARSLPGARVHGWPEYPSLVGRETFDATILAGSLGHIFRKAEADFPGTPYLQADPQKVAAWRARIAPNGAKIVGISWRGGVAHTREQIRSVGLAEFAPLVARKDLVCVSLQHGDVEADIAAFEAAHGLRVLRFAPSETHDLDDLAALVAALDVVVTVQNTNVHLAGALGVPAFAIIPEIPEWRYRVAGDRMPWYGSVELLRRSAERPLDRIVADIVARI